MKVAIVHDYIKEYGGAERVLEELLKLYPNADIYTSLYAPKFLGPHRERFEKYKIHQSFFKYIPLAYKLISPLRVLSPFAFKSFDLSSYDVVIVSQTGAYFPNLVRTKKNHELRIMNYESKNKTIKREGAVHICYTHTPPRYLYGYMTAREWKSSPFVRVIAEVVNHFLRMVDFYAAQKVDYFVANSDEVKKRIEKFYRREAEVVYPPVNSILYTVSSIEDKNEKENTQYAIQNTEYFLAGGRLARAKGMGVIVEAFIKNGKPLKIFGKGFANYANILESQIANKKSLIEFVGEVSDEEKLSLMQGAKAYIFASYDEDFGITPVEAMGQGTPVVAFKSGGVQETVVEGVTGVFYTPNNPEELNKAIKKVETLQSRHTRLEQVCVAQAEKFSEKEFDSKIKKLVAEVT